MADRRVKYILEVDYEGESVTARAADDLREVDDAAKQASDGLEQASGGFSKVQASIVTMQSALGIAQQGFQAIQQAAQFAYETLSEGAALEQQSGQFENLAQSIGTTADALMNDLGPALQGLQSNSEMIEGSGQLISLGLANTHEEVVALSEVAGQLDWDMQVLGLTIANQSTARLDALGLSISSVKAKMEEFKSQGMATEEAFKWAVIEAGRDKIEILGSAADTSAGQLKILGNIVENVQDEFARGAAEGFASTLGVIAGTAPAAGAGMEMAARGASSFLAEIAGYAVISQFSDDLAYFIERGKEAADEAERQERAHAAVTQAQRDAAEMAAIYAAEQEEVAFTTQIGADALDGALASWNEYVRVQDIAGASMAMAAENGFYLYESQQAAAEAAAELAERQELAASAAEAWATYTAEITAYGGDQFTMFSQADEAWNFADAVYAAADAAGAGAGPLADLAVSMGLIDQATADAATAAAQQQVIAENLAGAAANGQISWDNYAAAVQRAIDVLNGAPLVDLGPREAPAMEDRGFREGFQEDLVAQVGEMEPIPLAVELERESIQAAVDEARGIVEGFTSPEQAYEAVMSMDISDVESKVGTAKSLIDGLPEEKRINITVTASGMEILEQLRALGAIP